jgi:hypothetical protein
MGCPGFWWEEGDGELSSMGGVHELLVGQLDGDGVQSWLGLGQVGFGGEIVARATSVNYDVVGRWGGT